jgi:hypothetical protein
MASPGVVGMAEVITPNSTVSSGRLAGTPAMWAYVWVGAAALVLIFIHLAVVGRR